MSVATLLNVAAAMAQAGDVANGRRLFLRQCFVCHTVDKGGPTNVGPNLHGIFGRDAATGSGYRYSSALRISGIVWDDETVTAYLRDPVGTVPGTTMVYPGLKPQDQLNDVIAYLKQVTR